RMINRAKFGRTVKELKDPPLRMLFISRANPVLQLPNTNEVIEAMEQVEFKVSIEHFLTDTAQMADIVLPATYFLEEEDVAVPGIWSDCLGYMHKSLERYYEARPEYEIYTELAERLGLTKFPRLSGEQWLELMLEPMVAQGLQLEDLKAKGFAKNPLAKTVPWEDMQFATASGKFEIIPAAELEVCLKHLMEEQQEKYRLLTVHSRKTLHSQHMLDSKESLPKLHINAADASGEGINTGDVVKLYNGYGTLEAEAVISDSAERGILYMNEGWWLKNGGSVNRLTPDGISDIGNQGIMNHCFCDILKVRRN
ncbi:MAG TPA: molybdopterin dinucleotide binding domain-containing protein, partial [Candidatus Nitrosocosmicus sp.]|nr:molybdopterin dinucleotide binding domain-containing protein [Candidatus Nitrosocosmicus sp.]